MAPVLSSWPWDNFGSYKYLLYGPLVAKVLHSRPWERNNNTKDLWYLHILILCTLRGLVHTLWCSFSNSLFLTRNRRIIKEGVDFEQIDKEWHWDNFIILQAMLGAIACYTMLPTSQMGSINYIINISTSWNLIRGLMCAMLLHIAVSEPLYYMVHRAFHASAYLYTHYHSLHHSIKVPQSFTAGLATPLEHLALSLVMGIPILGASFLGCGSSALVYAYVLGFDFLRCMMHSNVEVIPIRLFDAFPPLKYLLSTPTYHAVHHRDRTCNFCLFMPAFDSLGGTLDGSNWELLQRKVCSAANDENVPGFVFLAHVVDLGHSIHAPFILRSNGSLPFTTRLLLLPIWPVAFVIMLLMWRYSKTFLYTFYNLRGKLHQTWAVPRFGFQYFIPSAMKGINSQIEMAILTADRIGVKVLSLAALNKNEGLNGGGTLFVKKHKDLRVRVVHGNTLTAAVILNEIVPFCNHHHNIDQKVDGSSSTTTTTSAIAATTAPAEIFLTGATSKLGRAIALYLCRKRVRVLMLTLSTDRFLKIQREAPPEFQHYLVQVTKYEAAQNCNTWVVGKWLMPSEQKWAPPGTHFHQFVVPPIIGFRKDCTYGKLAAMKLPPEVQGLGSCEYTLDRGVIHACHAGGVVHFLEGWTHHEVGAIDVDRIDLVWEAAMRHGLRPA